MAAGDLDRLDPDGQSGAQDRGETNRRGVARAGPRRRRIPARAPDRTDESLGARIRLCRLVAGLSHQEVAEAAGVTFQQIQKYEWGNNRISASMLARIAQRLGVPLCELFGEVAGREPLDAHIEALSEPGARVPESLRGPPRPC